jgi:hypothetical protein
MPRIPIFRLGGSAEESHPPRLTGYTPSLSLEGLQLGVDNLRHDVFLSPKFVEQVRVHISRLILRHGALEGLLSAETSQSPSANHFLRPAVPKARGKTDPSELKPLLAALHTAALQKAKSSKNLMVDVLARVAIFKFLRQEVNSQFAEVLERCRIMLRNYEGLRQQKALEYREKVAAFQVAKKIILRKVGMELLHTLREIEKETLARMRQSLFGSRGDAEYKLFLNPLLFTEDGRDTYLNAEHYVMLGNFDRDPDRFANIRRVVCEFLQSLNLGRNGQDESAYDPWLNVPENAYELVSSGSPDPSSGQGRGQETRLEAWIELLEREGIMDYVIASYEVVPLLAEYSPRINAQQLKNALITREERERVEKLVEEHGRLSSDSLRTAVARVGSCNAGGRSRLAARFLHDFLRYHRDLRRLQAVTAAFDSVNLIGNEKLRELSSLNGTLYDVLLLEEQKPVEAPVLRHVIMKADVRDSTRLTRSLLERGLNPASYFSLNLFDPVNKLLPKYGASKVFLEGDAIILTILERDDSHSPTVGRACVLAREIIDIVRGYNQLLQRSGLPPLELGVGISFQDSPPMYLMDGTQRIMISDALNESDRLSSCNKRVRKPVEALDSPFHIYAFQTVSDGDAAESSEDFNLKYNLNGIRMSEAAFVRLQQEISLEECHLQLPELWGDESFRLFSGLVSMENDIFRKIIVRQSRIAQINPRDFSLQSWTDHFYY